MHLPTLRAKRRLEDDLDYRLTDPERLTPRKAAVSLLSDKIRDGQAGVDCYDHQVFIVELGPNERTWGTVAVGLTGRPFNRVERPDRTVRLYVYLDADVYRELGLDRPDAPEMVEPLASRGLAAVALIDSALAALPASSSPHAITPGEPVSTAAMRAARESYDRNGIAEKDQVH